MNDIHLSAKDNNTIVQANVNTALTISLDANATTGYTWKIDSIDESIVQNTNSGFANSKATAPGAASEQYFTFKTINKGHSKISLKYARSWQGDASIIKRFEIEVDVA